MFFYNRKETHKVGKGLELTPKPAQDMILVTYPPWSLDTMQLTKDSNTGCCSFVVTSFTIPLYYVVILSRIEGIFALEKCLFFNETLNNTTFCWLSVHLCRDKLYY